MLAALGYSLNNLSLFGLVLAIGIVVDDAIVVVENVERNLEHGLIAAAKRRARRWTKCRRALVAIVLVLCAVFVPTLFLTGLSGAFYQPVRGDHLDRDGHLADAVADPVAGARRAAAASRMTVTGRRPAAARACRPRRRRASTAASSG